MKQIVRKRSVAKKRRVIRNRNPQISVGEMILMGTHPSLYAAKKAVEWGVDIYKKLKD